MSLTEHAKKELELAGYFKPTKDRMNKLMAENVMELIKVFAKQGHSGFSASFCIQLFRQLASYKIILPLTGENDEWMKIDYPKDPLPHMKWQNKRCHSVFKRADGSAYDNNGKVFEGPDGERWTSQDSSVEIEKFPYIPKTEIVKVHSRRRENGKSN